MKLTIFSQMGMKTKLLLILSIPALIATAVFSINIYHRNHEKALAQARAQGMSMIGRSAEMFLVSTRRFHDDWQKTATDPVARKRILADWNRTIFAVDQAVINDFGKDQPRVRLIGDEKLFGYRPLGGDNTTIKIESERKAGEEQLKGKELVECIEDGYLRLSVPLWSDIHQGCAECHIAVVENDQADMTRRILLGSLNAYLPLDHAYSEARNNTWFTIGYLGMIIAALIAVIYIFMRRSVITPINGIVQLLKNIAEGEGDLTARITVKNHDEIGELAKWFNLFVEKLQQLIGGIGSAANEVASASTEIAAASEEMATTLDQQTREVVQISSAIEEMSASIFEVAKQSANASEQARQAGQVAEEGGTAVAHTVRDMERIREVVGCGTENVTKLGHRGEEIGEIIGVINDIADQTNLLALNAAIEAARAGEHGRGFAVVADEVRKLADRTTKATDEVARAIRAIQGDTANAVANMTEGSQQVHEGVERAKNAGDSLRQIVNGAQQVAAMIQGIASAAEEQQSTSSQISHNVETISSMSGQVTDGANQAAAAAAQLSVKAEQLRGMVSRFKV